MPVHHVGVFSSLPECIHVFYGSLSSPRSRLGKITSFRMPISATPSALWSTGRLGRAGQRPTRGPGSRPPGSLSAWNSFSSGSLQCSDLRASGASDKLQAADTYCTVHTVTDPGVCTHTTEERTLEECVRRSRVSLMTAAHSLKYFLKYFALALPLLHQNILYFFFTTLI